MPTFGDDGSHYRRMCELRKQQAAKLRRLGIVENSSKWFNLMYRR